MGTKEQHDRVIQEAIDMGILIPVIVNGELVGYTNPGLEEKLAEFIEKKSKQWWIDTVTIAIPAKEGLEFPAYEDAAATIGFEDGDTHVFVDQLTGEYVEAYIDIRWPDSMDEIEGKALAFYNAIWGNAKSRINDDE